MTTFTFDDNPISSVPEGFCPREVLSHLLATRHAPNDDPFYAIDLGLLPQLVDLWRKLFPSIRPFYAVKCNPDPLMLSLLARLGVGFDCASKGEIRTVTDLLSSLDLSTPDYIIYANPCKQLSHIQYSKLKGVTLATFDNSCELHKYALHHSSCDLVIRIAVDDSSSLCKLSNKYGCLLSSVTGLLQLARQLSLSVVGVSFHVGSGCVDGEVFKMALRDAREVFDVALTHGYKFSLLDIGGGFPSCLGDKPSPSLSFMQALSATINTSIAANFSDWVGLRVIAEPGRFFASSCHLLAVSVTSSRSCVPSPGNDNTEVMHYVNEGVYGAFNCILFDHQTPEPRVLSPRRSPALRSSLWGPSCDGLDQILKETLLPPLQLGEWLFFEEMGAYTRASRSDFNGFAAPLNYYYVTTCQRSRLLALLVPSHVPLSAPERKQTDLSSYPLKPQDIELLVSALM